jgi:UDPglucose 6-dehydrogenase
MNIAVIGTGYVGLVTGTCLSEFGHTVTCLDVDKEKVQNLRKGILPIYEPDLDTYIARNAGLGRLRFSTDRQSALKDADVVFMALPTPPLEDGSTDLSYILEEAKKIGPYLKKNAVVVNKSTVPAGTAKKVEDILDTTANHHIDVVSNPEFLREGMAVHDFFYPDRVVIGANTVRSRKLMRKLYEPLERNAVQILFMGRTSAEVAKYAANSFLATKISFMNEIANLCEKLGADIDSVRNAIGTDTRIGPKFLFPGIGYGGSCFPKDLIGLVKTAEQHGQSMGIVEAAIAANSKQQLALVDKVVNYFGKDLSGKHFALWGLAFKPNTDDIREAPARIIIEKLLELGATVAGYDPEANKNMRAHFKDSEQFTTADNQYDALVGADALLIATEWQEFYTPDFALIKKRLKAPLIFDGRNIFTKSEIKAAGDFRYESIGRRIVQA